jgi:hypothetical protein
MNHQFIRKPIKRKFSTHSTEEKSQGMFMKKVFLSAFAMSLIFSSLSLVAQTESIDDFLGLESEILPELKGEDQFTELDLRKEDDWQVSPQKVKKNLSTPHKGHDHSLIPWSNLDPEDWLSIQTWLAERKIKDATPNWKLRLRQAKLGELAGKMLNCHGTCYIYRGSRKARGQHLSRILEGDEVKTTKDSVAWIYMMDGSLLRLSSETSVSINEFNIGESQIFILARLNQGHVFWHPRHTKELTPDFQPETDSASLPLMVREANQQYFERDLFKRQNDQARLSEVFELDENAVTNQFLAINKILNRNNGLIPLPTKVMFVSPNSTVVGAKVSFDYLYYPGGKGYLKKRSTEEGEEFSLHLRGYNDSLVIPIADTTWHEIIPNGRVVTPLLDVPGILQITELLTKRIKTIELAREIWVEAFTVPMLENRKNPTLMAREFGYTIWGEELKKRFDFLVEYTRRIETTNLRSLENLLLKLEKNGEVVSRELSEDHYRASLNHYLLGLKSRYDNKKMKVREMNDFQYYAWILTNGK